MKRNTSNILVAILLLLGACSGSKKEAAAPPKPEQVIAEANEVIGIGKIQPEGGIISLSALVSGNIEAIHMNAGDRVKKGELLLELGASAEELAATESRAQVAAQAARNTADAYEVRLAEIKLHELEAKYQTSKTLAEKGAETQEMLNTDFANYQQQLQKVAQAKQTVRANRQSLNELQQRRQLSALNLKDRRILSPAAGVILNMDAKQGQVLQANTVFAELAPEGDVVAACEVDELYASKIKLGQRVLMYKTSSPEPIAEGQISFVGASLQDKSILYEKVGEGTDRRVRRLTVRITKSAQPLLINDKVECKILLN